MAPAVTAPATTTGIRWPRPCQSRALDRESENTAKNEAARGGVHRITSRICHAVSAFGVVFPRPAPAVPCARAIRPGGVNLSLGMLWRREPYFAKERASV